MRHAGLCQDRAGNVNRGFCLPREWRLVVLRIFDVDSGLVFPTHVGMNRKSGFPPNRWTEKRANHLGSILDVPPGSKKRAFPREPSPYGTDGGRSALRNQKALTGETVGAFALERCRFFHVKALLGRFFETLRLFSIPILFNDTGRKTFLLTDFFASSFAENIHGHVDQDGEFLFFRLQLVDRGEGWDGVVVLFPGEQVSG